MATLYYTLKISCATRSFILDMIQLNWYVLILDNDFHTHLDIIKKINNKKIKSYSIVFN